MVVNVVDTGTLRGCAPDAVTNGLSTQYHATVLLPDDGNALTERKRFWTVD